MRPQRSDCRVCGGDGYLASRPEGEADCPYCKGTGTVTATEADTSIRDEGLR